MGIKWSWCLIQVVHSLNLTLWCRFVFSNCGELQCRVRDRGIKHCDVNYSVDIVVVIHKTIILHSTCYFGIHNLVRVAWTYRHQWSLQHMESGQVGFPRFSRRLLWRLVRLHRDRPPHRGNSSLFLVEFFLFVFSVLI